MPNLPPQPSHQKGFHVEHHFPVNFDACPINSDCDRQSRIRLS
jgi:hypothetical protein